jgi:proteasome assembly chaperone (PAC2) family protein
MTENFDLWEYPEADEIYMLAGWQQWADAGSISSGLPRYLVQRNEARQIGKLSPDGYYLFQIPGTHGLVRPIVKFKDGFPEWLQKEENDIYYIDLKNGKGLVIFMGSEPHLDIQRYADTFLGIARALGVKRIIGFGGVYGEVPYDKERMVSGIYSMPHMKEEMETHSVRLSDYQGGASIGSYLCRMAGERGMEYAAFYSFAPIYDFSESLQIENSIQIENDFTSWLAVMRRVNHMLKLGLDLSDLERKHEKLMEAMDEKVAELEESNPQLGVREYFNQLAAQFEETRFEPLADFLEDELSRLFDKFEGDEKDEPPPEAE